MYYPSAIMKKAFGGLIALTLLLAVSCSSGEKRYNFVLIGVDTLRADHVGCYGYDRDTTPNTDGIASGGAVFQNAVSPSSWTLPAFMTLFTSQVPPVHGVISEHLRVKDSRTMLAEVLKSGGYDTAGFISGAFLHRDYGFGRGFVVYEDLVGYTDHIAGAIQEDLTLDWDIHKKSHQSVSSPRIFEAADKWLRNRSGKPFFMFVHMFDPHYDYIPPPPYDTMFDPGYEGDIDPSDYEHSDEVHADMPREDLEHIIALYDGEIRFVDHYIGKLMDTLDDLGLRENTVVVILGDHGEEFFEHGNKGHRKNLYDECVKVPLIIDIPGMDDKMKVREQVRLLDVAPTLCELTGLAIPDGFMGTSLMPFIERTGGKDRLAYMQLHKGFHGLRSRSWKLLLNLDTNDFRVLDLLKDPEEKTPAGPKIRDRAGESYATVHNIIKDIIAEMPPQERGAQSFELRDEVRENLKSLGYLN